MEAWAAGSYQRGSAEQTAAANAGAIAGMSLLSTVIDYLQGDAA